MPELAEVALFARDLNKIAVIEPLTKVTFANNANWGDVIVPATIKKSLKTLEGKSVYFQSFGKALCIYNLQEDEPCIEFRLAMTGQFHDHLKPSYKNHYFIKLTFGANTIYYADPRRFGRTHIPRPISPYSLGGFDRSRGLILKKSINISTDSFNSPKIKWLLQNGEDTGVGNYMANEALGRLNLSPFEPCGSKEEALQILCECQKIARESFKAGGNSFATKFFLPDGKEGRYSDKCRFYQNPEVPKIIYNNRPVYSYFTP